MAFKALLYKNWCIRKRYYFKTPIEVLLPVVLVGILLYVKDNLPSSDQKPRDTTHSQKDIIFPVQSKSELLDIKTMDLELNVLYAPNTEMTRNIMEMVNKMLANSKFTGFNNESDVEAWFIQHKNTTNIFSAEKVKNYGVIFNRLEMGKGCDVKYTIRTTNPYVFNTRDLFPELQLPGPMEAGSSYFHQGFVQLQVALDEAILTAAGLQATDWTIQEFPYPEHKVVTDDFQKMLIYSLQFFVGIFGFYFTLASVVTTSISEKSSGLTERMKMTGVSVFSLICDYLIYAGMIYFISTFLVSILLKIPVNGGAILEKSNFLIIWLVFLLYCTCGVFFMLAISSLFNNITLGSSFSSLLYFGLYIVFYQLSQWTPLCFMNKFLLSLFPTVSFVWTFPEIANFEASGTGVGFGNLFESFDSTGFSLGFILLANICGTVLFMFLYWYISSIKPGPYGRAEPWYFIIPSAVLTKCRVTPKNGLLDDVESISDASDDSVPLYEKVPSGLQIGLKIVNLKKRIGQVTAVRRVSLDIYKGQITVLLGHNGAGKTTTMSMISGFISPTQGNVYSKGKSIFNDLKSYQKHLGLCTQYDLLHELLSVQEHLILFGMIKGLTRESAEIEAMKIIKQLDLSGKKNDCIGNLSGGMKRRLCLGIALLACPEVLILDEPTSGLDPESRREVWNILLKLREERTFILTTHFMEEADVLGDRIAILDHGEIVCYGSSLFLKKHYGAGYQLTIISPDVNHEKIESIIKNKIKETTTRNKTGEQIIFTLPSSRVEEFPELFKDLEKEECIIEMGISCTTMEDVFLKVGQQSLVKKTSKDTSTIGRKSTVSVVPSDKDVYDKERLNCFKLFTQRYVALFVKNIRCSSRDWFNILFYLVLSIGAGYITMKLNSIDIENQLYNNPPLSLDLSIYGSTEVLMKAKTQNKLYDSLKDLVERDGSSVTRFSDDESIIGHLLETGRQDEVRFRNKLLVAAELNATSAPKLLYSSIGLHAPVVAVGLLYNALFSAANTGPDMYRIEAVNHPYTFNAGICSPTGQAATNLSWISMIPLVLIMSIRYFILRPHAERRSDIKHLQLMTGVSPFTYWGASFAWDMILYSFFLLCIIAVIISLDVFNLLSQGYFGVFALVAFLFGFSQIWCAYLASFFFQKSSTAMSLYLFIVSLTAYCGVVVVLIVKDHAVLKFILKLNPFCVLILALYKFSEFMKNSFICAKCTTSFKYPQCTPDHKFNKSIFSWSADGGINEELIFLSTDWLLYAFLIFLFEFGFFAYIWNFIKTKYYTLNSSGIVAESVEADVAKEKDAVDTALQDSTFSTNSPAVIVDGLVKKMNRSFTAVNGVSFTVREGEVFGLLGVNGAGKSTTFNMLTGKLFPTAGNAYINNYSLRKDKRTFLSKIGYCPQFDGLWEDLTGQEQLELFALLRGVSREQVADVVSQWIYLLDLEEYSSVLCKAYSGGTKRKLSTALSLIGDPQIILLDEPTTGVDPMTRRNLWNVLKETHSRKQSIVLSSHSMEECEAVCHRLTIMARGCLQCIGNVQHLKSLYGGGFTIFLMLKTCYEDAQLACLKEDVLRTFGSTATLQDEHVTLLQYLVQSDQYKLSFMFETVQQLKAAHNIVEDYIVNDSNLEQVFLSFARKNEK